MFFSEVREYIANNKLKSIFSKYIFNINTQNSSPLSSQRLFVPHHMEVILVSFERKASADRLLCITLCTQMAPKQAKFFVVSLVFTTVTCLV